MFGPPVCWAGLSVVVWYAYGHVRGWDKLGVWEARQIMWGMGSTILFFHFLLLNDDFKGWGDVYFFCGEDLRFCTCNFRWNYLGWMKAFVLWNFVLSAALGLQRLAIQLGLEGMLPGEEVVTKDSFISICWRLIPYWLNNWEQQWGAECSSMLFELPHFAVELLVILPCVQILCARMRVMAVPPGIGGQGHMEPNVLKCRWEVKPQYKDLLPRLRGNLRVMLFLSALTGLAAFNALVVPLQLERQVLAHPARPLLHAVNGTVPEHEPARSIVQHRVQRYYEHKACTNSEQFVRNIRKHAREINKMQEADHMALIPVVESALAIMRLSCEKFFVLLSVFVTYLLFRRPPWPARIFVRFISRVSSTFQKVILYSFPAVCWLYGAGFFFSMFVSVVFWGPPLAQLYEGMRTAVAALRVKTLRPATAAEIERMGGNCAICWGEMVVAQPGAGAARGGSTAGTGSGGARGRSGAVATYVIRLQQDGRHETQHTGGDDIAGGRGDGADSGSGGGGANGSSPAGYSLACGHSYHSACLMQWLQQCHAQSVAPTCPMCQATIQMELRWHWPRPWGRQAGAGRVEGGLELPEDVLDDPHQPGGAGADDGFAEMEHHEELLELLHDMPQLPMAMDHAMGPGPGGQLPLLLQGEEPRLGEERGRGQVAFGLHQGEQREQREEEEEEQQRPQGPAAADREVAGGRRPQDAFDARRSSGRNGDGDVGGSDAQKAGSSIACGSSGQVCDNEGTSRRQSAQASGSHASQASCSHDTGQFGSSCGPSQACSSSGSRPGSRVGSRGSCSCQAGSRPGASQVCCSCGAGQAGGGCGARQAGGGSGGAGADGGVAEGATASGCADPPCAQGSNPLVGEIHMKITEVPWEWGQPALDPAVMESLWQTGQCIIPHHVYHVQPPDEERDVDGAPRPPETHFMFSVITMPNNLRQAAGMAAQAIHAAGVASGLLDGAAGAAALAPAGQPHTDALPPASPAEATEAATRAGDGAGPSEGLQAAAPALALDAAAGPAGVSSSGQPARSPGSPHGDADRPMMGLTRRRASAATASTSTGLARRGHVGDLDRLPRQTSELAKALLRNMSENQATPPQRSPVTRPTPAAHTSPGMRAMTASPQAAATSAAPQPCTVAHATATAPQPCVTSGGSEPSVFERTVSDWVADVGHFGRAAGTAGQAGSGPLPDQGKQVWTAPASGSAPGLAPGASHPQHQCRLGIDGDSSNDMDRTRSRDVAGAGVRTSIMKCAAGWAQRRAEGQTRGQLTGGSADPGAAASSSRAGHMPSSRN